MVTIGLTLLTMFVRQAVPVPVTTLGPLRRAVLKDEAGGPSKPWKLTLTLWNATWGESAFGIGPQWEDTRAFGFRVPPDSDLKRYAGGSPFLVEGYRDGFPTYGIRRNGDVELCRPLGFVYSPDGRCTNATVFELVAGRWQERRLTLRTKTLLARHLNFDAPAKLSDFKTPWFKIVAAGYGTYWIDRLLVCVGPSGSCCRLSPEEKDVIAEMLAGKWDFPVKRRSLG